MLTEGICQRKFIFQRNSFSVIFVLLLKLVRQWRGAGWSEKLVIQHLHLASPRYQTCKLASQKCQSGKIEIFMQWKIQKYSSEKSVQKF